MRLTLIIYTLAATALSGVAVIAVLTMGMYSVKPILLAAIAGAVVAAPVAWFVARMIEEGLMAIPALSAR
jgi:hypothetical protein